MAEQALEVAVVYSSRKPESEVTALNIKKISEDMGFSCSCMSLDDALSSESISSDFLVVLGGDGTILRAIHRLEDPETPVLAISYGRGGYLAEAGPEEALESVSRMLSGSYYLERHIRLAVELDGEKVADAVNEAYISNSQPGKVVEYSLVVDGAKLGRDVGDGLIIATPIGSTAYSLSSGGPAVDDSLECLVITPVCPITYAKPIVLAPSKEVVVEILAGEASVLVDGSIRRPVRGGKLMVRKSNISTVFVRTGRRSLFERRLRRRLGR